MTPGHAGAPRRHRGARDLRACQDLSTSNESEFRHVGCHALVLHGGDDLNVPANDALATYRAIRAAGNDDVQQAVLPWLDHYFKPTPADPSERLWVRVSLKGLRQPMGAGALDVIGGWAVRVPRAER